MICIINQMVGGKGVGCPNPKNETPKVYYVDSLAYHYLTLPIVLTKSYSLFVQFHGVRGKGSIFKCLSGSCLIFRDIVPKFMAKMLVLLCLVVGCQGQEVSVKLFISFKRSMNWYTMTAFVFYCIGYHRQDW